MFNRRSFAVFVFAGVSVSAQSALDQLKAYKDGTAAPAQVAKQSVTAATATAQKYDIVGIKVGMTIREALAALKAHSVNFRLTPQSLKYDVVPNPLTYGIWAATPNVRGASIGPPDSEQFYFLIAMPPNQEVVSKVTRLVRWSLNTAPVQETLMADLLRKYGAPSSDTGADQLNSYGSRELVWADDARGNRVQGAKGKELSRCTQDPTTAFSLVRGGGLDSFNLAPDLERVKGNVEQGYGKLGGSPEQCAQYTMIRAVLYNSRLLRYPPAPEVVGGLVTMIGSAPLDHSASDTTHDFLVRAQKNRDANQTKAAEQNRPKL